MDFGSRAAGPRVDSARATEALPTPGPAAASKKAERPRPGRQVRAPVNPQVPAQPEGTGLLRVRTEPATAQILLDGRKIAVGVAFDIEVPAGVRRLRISAPGFVTFDTTITVRVGEPANLGTVTLKVAGGP